jgi:ankyrin repeat protein
MRNLRPVDPEPLCSIAMLQKWLTGDVAAAIESVRAAGCEPIYRGGLSPMHLLVQRGSVVFVTKALASGLAADSMDDYSRTPLMVASALVSHLHAGAIAEALVSAGAAIAATDRFGNSALHYAARSGGADAFAVLLSAGANPDAKNRSTQTARLLVEKRADHELWRVLRRAELHRDANVQGAGDVRRRM